MITDDIKAALEGVTQWPWYFHDGETLANTKLIAAAPDLLYRALGEIESLQAQLRTYGDQRAAEARDQMREECIKACQAAAGRGWSYYEEERRPVLRGKALGADVCVERIKELP